MKRGKVLMTVLVVLAVLFASCSNGLKDSEGEGGASGQKVMVSLGVDVEGGYIQKTIDATGFDLGSLSVWYKATHKWQEGSKPVSGDTAGKGDANDFVQIPNFTSGSPATLGYFTAGMWDFEVEVRKDSTVVYKGEQRGVAIYTNNQRINIAITVTPVSTSNGTVSISVQVPTTGSNERLVMKYTGASDGTVNLTRHAPINDPEAPGYVAANVNLTTFDTTNLSLVPGAYTFTLLYYDNSNTGVAPADPTPGAQNGGVAVAVNVVGSQNATIRGLLEDGKWHPVGITINVPGVTVDPLTHTPATPNGYVAFGDTITYRCTAHSDNDVSYAWFVNGSPVGSDQDTFPFATGTAQGAYGYGYYEVTCVVTDEFNSTAYAKDYIEVSNTIIPPGSITGGSVTSNKTHATEGEIVTLTVTPDQNYSLEWVKLNDSEVGVYDIVGGKAFYMPAGTATITASFTTN